MSRARIIARFFMTLTFAVLWNCRAEDGDEAAWLWSAIDAPARYLFTRPEYEASEIERRAPRDFLVRWIDGARHEIIIRSYGFNEPEVIAALVRAHHRGVDLHLLLSPDLEYPELNAAELPLRFRRGAGLQHAKLALIDGARLFTGTGNFTVSDFFFSHNAFAAFPLDAAAASALRDALVSAQGPFAPIDFASGRILFSPEMGPEIQWTLAGAIAAARSDLRLLMFNHSDRALSAALQAAVARGVRLQAIYDDDGNDGELSPDAQGALLNAGLGLADASIALEGARRLHIVDGVEHGGHLHHKTLLVDGWRTLTGSYNWSLSARDSNAELVLDLHDPLAAAAFAEEFERIRRRSRILPRPPQGAPAADPSQPACPADSFCFPQTSKQAALIGGVGPWFSICTLELVNGASEGRCGQGSLGAMPDAAAWFRPEIIANAPGAAVATGAHRAELPCAAASNCQAANVVGVSLSGAWLWLAAEMPAMTRVSVLKKDGPGQWQTIVYRGEQLITLPDPTGDQILFLESENGTIYVLAIQSGAGFDRQLELFLSLLRLSGGPQITAFLSR